MNSTLVRQGKVRDVYDLGDHFLMIASDRISAFDWILPTSIPDKGRVLTGISEFWFDWLPVEHHKIPAAVEDIDLPEGLSPDWVKGRGMIVRKCEVVPVECVVRGYLVGSGWRDYRDHGSVCGIKLGDGLRNCEKFSEPLFTPATKAESGHDENISFAEMANVTGSETASLLRDKSLEIYSLASQYAEQQGLILADTKFEWGWHEGRLLLVDEVLTPDSSRYWPADRYEPGTNQPSFDKQFVREYLEATGWDKNSDPPLLPDSVVRKTREKYVEAYERLTERTFPWQPPPGSGT